MTNHDIIIGIDPDVEASGVATLCPKTKRVEATTMTLPALLDNLRRVRNEYPTLTVAVVVEASWTTAHNFHTLYSDSKAVAAKKRLPRGAQPSDRHRYCRHSAALQP